ncbi:MAG: hypothetical protein COA86_14020 [Kangiella sp.]|nr:MAG: hypothetical protein COA86_14020 [Kangiella sp.]
MKYFSKVRNIMTLVNTNKPQNIARISGLLYLLLIPLGIFGILYVPNILVVPGDTVATIAKINDNNMLFRLSIVNALIAQLVNIFLVLTLYKLLKPVNRNYAVLMVIFSLLAVPIAMLNELNYCAILILTKTELLAGNGSEQYIVLIQLFLDLHESGVIIAQIFWGLWLLPMGRLIIDSGFLPKTIGLMMVIAGLGYIVDVFNWLVFPELKFGFSEFTFIGEIVLPLWLLIKGVNLQHWRRSNPT